MPCSKLLQARSEFESKLIESEKKLDVVSRSVGDLSKMQARLSSLEKDLQAERTKLDEANVTIVDLQGTKAKLADKVNKLTIESENRFAGIAMTGKNVVFLVDMSGSMDRLDENTLEATKWGTVRDTVCKVMRSLPVDVFLGAHGAFYGMTGKHKQLEKGGPNPFIDPEGFKTYVDRSEQAFLTMLEGQKKAETK